MAEWEVDEKGRRFRMVGPIREYEMTVSVDGFEVPESELAEYNERKRAAAAPAPAPAPAPAERCPFSSSLSGACNARCALRTAHGCSLAFLVDRAPSVDTAGKKCPFSPYPCTERCALYQQHGCVLTAF